MYTVAVFFERAFRLLLMPSRAGRRFLLIASAAAILMAVGPTSLDDWLMLTWSFGWTFFPSSSEESSASNSFAFMFRPVPEPVW